MTRGVPCLEDRHKNLARGTDRKQFERKLENFAKTQRKQNGDNYHKQEDCNQPKTKTKFQTSSCCQKQIVLDERTHGFSEAQWNAKEIIFFSTTGPNLRLENKIEHRR